MNSSCPILYHFPLSANGHRARLILSHLGVEFEERIVNLADHSHKASDYLAINPLGQVPALVHGKLTLWDSHAIAFYVCEQLGGEAGLELWPADPSDRARISRWAFFDANELHNGIGLARNHFTFGIELDGKFAQNRGLAALKILNEFLGTRDWLELDRATLADLICYPLISVAGEAMIDVSDYSNVKAWLARIGDLGIAPVPSLAEFRASIANV